MPIERHAVKQIMPSWAAYPANRYVSHPTLRTAMIQTLDDPEAVYVVTDQMLPQTSEHAQSMVRVWREQHETAPD